MTDAQKPMSDADRAEFERLRAEDKRRREAALEAEKNPPKTLAQQVEDDYIHNRGTIQTIARHYKITVDEVLHYIGQGEMSSVATVGDLIDSNEILPGTDDPIRKEGQPLKANYTTN